MYNPAHVINVQNVWKLIQRWRREGEHRIDHTGLTPRGPARSATVTWGARPPVLTDYRW